MINQTVLFILLLCLILFGIAIWYFQQQQKPILQQQPIIMQPILQDTAQIERQIEQIKVERDPPEVIRLNELLIEFESDPTRWDIVIAIADIYRKGAFPRFLPNENLALRCYKIASMCPNGKVAGMGQSKYIETRDDPLNNIDKAGAELPIDVGVRICELAESTIQSTPWHLFEKPQQKQHIVEPIAMPLTGLYDDLEWLTTNRDIETIAPVQYRVDAQNVHDHGVTKITKHNIDNLANNININNLNRENGGLDDIRATIIENNDLSVKTKEDALFVIEKLGDSKHSSFNVTEREALAMVWDKIGKTDDPIVRTNLKETLAKQLASSIEHGNIVCSSGKITRIMSTLDGVSNEPTRPTWAIREEIGTLANKLRDKYTVELGDTPAAGQRIREEFTKQVSEEYIEKLGMSKKIIEPLIIEYEMGF